jgi:hypothetical protein
MLLTPTNSKSPSRHSSEPLVRMNPDVTKEIAKRLAEYRAWSSHQQFQSCRLVQYYGLDVGAIDVPRSEIEAQTEGLLAEGFYADWSCHDTRLYLRVWEFGGDEPPWEYVYAERNLPDS